MPRDRDGDEWEYDDRRGRSSGTKTVFVVLGVLGGLVLLVVLACGGLGIWGFLALKKEVGSTLACMNAAETFMLDVQSGRSQAAYAATSSSYQSTKSQKQFDDFLAKHPILTKHTFHHTQNANLPMRNKGSTKKATLTYALNSSPDTDDPDDENDDPDKPKKADDKKKPNGLGSGRCTLVLIEENGKWVVDQFTVP